MVLQWEEAMQSTISITPSVVAAGTSCALKITSSEGFNLSKVGPAQVAISPATGISNLTVSDRSARGLTLSFTLASDAPVGDRDLTIKVNDVSASAKIKVVNISVSPRRIIAPPGTSTRRSLKITSSEGFDLSNVVRAQVRLTPPDAISNITIGNATKRGLTLSFLFSPDDVAATIKELTITVNNVSASAKFEVVPT
jgi:hypothetical protein